MWEFNFKNGRSAARTLTAGLALAGAALLAQPVAACTLENWNGGADGAIQAADPNGGVARYSGLCAAWVDGTGWVQDNNPGGIDRIVARFYVLNDLSSGTARIYAGFGSTTGSAERFRVTLNSNGTITLRDNATAQMVQQSGGSGKKWHSVEIDWAQGAGNGAMSLSVNGQDPVTAGGLANSGNALQSVRLGLLAGTFDGAITVDAYESRRSTPVGRLCRCNPNGNAEKTVTISDILAVVVEAGGGELAPGEPDCNEDGQVTISDILEAVVIAGTTGVCDL